MMLSQGAESVFHEIEIYDSLCVKKVGTKAERCKEPDPGTDDPRKITMRKKNKQTHSARKNCGRGILQKRHLFQWAEKIGVQLVQTGDSNGNEIKTDILI